VLLEEYIHYKPNTAVKNMLKKLINSTAWYSTNFLSFPR
jgi:hypothetical protein